LSFFALDAFYRDIKERKREKGRKVQRIPCIEDIDVPEGGSSLGTFNHSALSGAFLPLKLVNR